MKDLCFENLFLDIMPLVMAENKAQLDKWGIQNHEICEWLAITAEEFGELSKAIVEYRFGLGLPKEIVKEAIQTATLCLKIAEMAMKENE
jgi:hypothetical protein